MTWSFFERYCDEAYCDPLARTSSTRGKAPNGFDLDGAEGGSRARHGVTSSARPTTAASAPAAARAATSAGERTPPAASTRRPGRRQPRGQARDPGRRACRRGRSPSRAVARPAARSSATAKVEARRSASSPQLRTTPSRTSTARTSASPSASHGSGSGHAAVPTTTRSAPASRSASASATARIPPEACTGRPVAAATAAHELGAHAALAGAVEIDQMDPRRALARPPLGERDRVGGALDDVVVAAAFEPHGLVAENVHRRYDFDLAVEPHVAMLAC